MNKKIKLDTAKLLGFKIVAKGTAPTAKLGNKEVITGAKLGAKLGEKNY